MTTTIVKGLTADCWGVQAWGFEQCADCEYYLGEDCGGGSTLLKMIHGLGDSIMSGWKIGEFYKENPEGSFYDFLQWREHQDFTPLSYGLK